MNSHKTTITIMILILSLCVILLLFLLVFGLLNHRQGSFFAFDFYTKSKLVVDEEYSIDSIGHIVVDVSSHDLVIQKSHDSQIYIKGYDKAEDVLSASLESDTLVIEQKKKMMNFFNFSSHQKIEIYLPEGFAGDLQLKTTSGDIEFMAYPVDVQIHSTSGDIYADHLKDAVISTVSGEIEIKQVENMNGKTVSGDIDILSCNIVNIVSTSGDIHIEQGRLIQNAFMKTVSGDIQIHRLENVYIDTKTVSGSIHVYNSERKSDLELKIETVSGDIRVNS